jgi:hypothetical protein
MLSDAVFAGESFTCILSLTSSADLDPLSPSKANLSATVTANQSTAASNRNSGYFSQAVLDSALVQEAINSLAPRITPSISTPTTEKQIKVRRSSKIKLSSSTSSIALDVHAIELENQNVAPLVRPPSQKKLPAHPAQLTRQISGFQADKPPKQLSTLSELLIQIPQTSTYILYAFAQISGQVYFNSTYVKKSAFDAARGTASFNTLAYGKSPHLNYGTRIENTGMLITLRLSIDTRELPILTTPSTVLCSDVTLLNGQSQSCTHHFVHTNSKSHIQFNYQKAYLHHIMENV